MTAPPGGGGPGPRVLQLCAVDFTVRQFLSPLALELAARGCDVQVACTPGPHWQELQARGLRMVPMPIARSANPVSAAASILRLARWLRQRRIQVLHVHTPVASLVGRAAAFLARTPVVFYTAHGFYFHDRMPARSRCLHITLEWLAARLHTFLFCVSEEDSREAVRLGIARPDRVRFIANGVDAEDFDPARFGPEARRAVREELGIPADALVVAAMGRLVREKGFVEFFTAARSVVARVPNAHFLAVGDVVTSEHDDAKARIVELARHPDLAGHCHMPGMRSDIARILSACDVFCLPSYREGMPVSILEAMAMALPVVTTRIRGCREEVVDGETGFLTEVADADELAGAVTWLLEHREASIAMGAAGRARVLEMYTVRATLDRQWEVYERFLAGLRR